VHCKGEKGLHICSDIIYKKASHREESNITISKIPTESVKSQLMADFYSCSFGDREQRHGACVFHHVRVCECLRQAAKPWHLEAVPTTTQAILLLIREDHNKLLQDHCDMNSSLNLHPLADECLQRWQ